MSNKSVLIITEAGSGAPVYILSTALGFYDLGYSVYIYGNISQDHLLRLQSFRKEPVAFSYLNSSEERYKLEDYDLIIVNAGSLIRKDSDWVKWKWLPGYLNKKGVSDKLVITCFQDFSGRSKFYIKGEPFDGSQWGNPKINEFNYKVFAKRETNINENPDILPVDLGAERSFNQNKERDIFVSAIYSSKEGGGIFRSYRQQVCETIKRHFPNDSFVKGINDEVLDWRDYIDVLQRSKISITVPGNGFSTVRDKEILSCGCLLAYSPIPNPHLNEFVDQKNAIVYSDIQNLLEKLNDLYWNPDKLERIRQKCWETVVNCKQNMHEAEKIIKEVTV